MAHAHAEANRRQPGQIPCVPAPPSQTNGVPPPARRLPATQAGSHALATSRRTLSTSGQKLAPRLYINKVDIQQAQNPPPPSPPSPPHDHLGAPWSTQHNHQTRVTTYPQPRSYGCVGQAARLPHPHHHALPDRGSDRRRCGSAPIKATKQQPGTKIFKYEHKGAPKVPLTHSSLGPARRPGTARRHVPIHLPLRLANPIGKRLSPSETKQHDRVAEDSLACITGVLRRVLPILWGPCLLENPPCTPNSFLLLPAEGLGRSAVVLLLLLPRALALASLPLARGVAAGLEWLAAVVWRVILGYVGHALRSRGSRRRLLRRRRSSRSGLSLRVLPPRRQRLLRPTDCQRVVQRVVQLLRRKQRGACGIGGNSGGGGGGGGDDGRRAGNRAERKSDGHRRRRSCRSPGSQRTSEHHSAGDQAERGCACGDDHRGGRCGCGSGSRLRIRRGGYNRSSGSGKGSGPCVCVRSGVKHRRSNHLPLLRDGWSRRRRRYSHRRHHRRRKRRWPRMRRWWPGVHRSRTRLRRPWPRLRRRCPRLRRRWPRVRRRWPRVHRSRHRLRRPWPRVHRSRHRLCGPWSLSRG